MTSLHESLLGWTRHAGRSGPSLFARVLLMPGLMVREGAILIVARVLRVQVNMVYGRGLEPWVDYPGLGPGRRRAAAIMVPYAVTLALGVWVYASPILETSVLSTPLYRGSMAFLDQLRDQEWFVLYFFFGIDFFLSRGLANLLSLWIGTTLLGVSGPRWRDIDLLREDLGATVSGSTHRILDGLLILPRWFARFLDALHLEIPIGGVLVIVAALSLLTSAMARLDPFS